MKTELPVRSVVLKHRTGGLVVRWVTTSESPLLYVFAVFVRRWGEGIGEVGRSVLVADVWPTTHTTTSSTKSDFFLSWLLALLRTYSQYRLARCLSAATP
jgi:hypothetical protein